LDSRVQILREIIHHLGRIFPHQSSGVFEQLRIFELLPHDPLIELVSQMQHHAEAGVLPLLQQFLGASQQEVRLS
jgi:hypothetical protein